MSAMEPMNPPPVSAKTSCEPAWPAPTTTTSCCDIASASYLSRYPCDDAVDVAGVLDLAPEPAFVGVVIVGFQKVELILRGTLQLCGPLVTDPYVARCAGHLPPALALDRGDAVLHCDLHQ